MGTVLLAAGAKGRRYALPHATIHLHPASSGAQGYTEDVRIAFREQERGPDPNSSTWWASTPVTVEGHRA